MMAIGHKYEDKVLLDISEKSYGGHFCQIYVGKKPLTGG